MFPQLSQVLRLLAVSASWLRRVSRRALEVFRLGTAMILSFFLACLG